MEYLVYTIYSITLILLIVFNIYIYNSLFSSKFGKYPPFVPTDRKRKILTIDKVSSILKASKKQLTFLDAGSGVGTILIPLAKKFPNHNFIGIEWNKIPYLVSKFRSTKLKNIKLINEDMLKQNFNDVDIIYCYIVKNFEKPLSDKILSEMKKGSIIIANGVKFDNMSIIDEIKIKDRWLSNSIYIHELK